MIFITLGSQKFQFNRLLREIDRLCANKEVKEDVFAQIGYSDYIPQNYKYVNFMDREEFNKKMDEVDLIITHGGTGAIIAAVKKRKKVIAVPRMQEYGEHVDDHQIQIVKQFEELNLICACTDVGKINEAICIVKNKYYKLYQSNTMSIVQSIERYIETL